MANYADYIQFPDTMINGNYVERYAFPDSTGMYTDSVAWYRTPEGYKVADRTDAKLYKQDHPEGRPYVAKTYSEDERQKLFNDAFGKSKLDGVEQKSDGGILSQAPKELVELVQAAMSDESAAQQLSELKSKRPDLTDMIDQIIAELQGAQTMKCGGRVKKKALGSKLIKAKKASCGCILKKVGGRLIEVDSCTGLPVHRNGASIKKFESPAGALDFKEEGSGYFSLNGQKYYLNPSGTWMARNTVNNQWEKLNDQNTLSKLQTGYSNMGYVFDTEDNLNSKYLLSGTAGGGTNNRNYYYRWGDNGELQRLKTDLFSDDVSGRKWETAQKKQDGTYYIPSDIEKELLAQQPKVKKESDVTNTVVDQNKNEVTNPYRAIKGSPYIFSKQGDFQNKYALYNGEYLSNFGVHDAVWDNQTGSWVHSGYTYDKDAGWKPKEAVQNTVTPLFTGDLRSYGARKQWVSDNAEYLKSQGWDDARIAGYRGSAADNIALQKAISGKAAWDAEQEAARQTAVAQRADDQQRQQKFVEEMALSHPLEKAAIIPPKTSAIVKPQGLQPTAEQIKTNTLTAMLGQNTSDRRMAKYGKAYDFIKTGANSVNMSAADTHRANRLATKMHRAGLMENGGQLNYANYLN